MSFDFDIYEINTSDLEEAKSILKARFPEMIDGYIEDAADYLDEIKEGVTTGDLDQIRTNAHPLKSSSASLGLIGVSNIARLIEEGVKNGETVGDVQEKLPTLEDALSQATEKLQALMS